MGKRWWRFFDWITWVRDSTPTAESRTAQKHSVQILIMAEEIVNPFPSPPSQYKRYTKSNLALLSLLRARSSTNVHDVILPDEQHRILDDQGELPTFDITALERPRADWIVEDGGYETFGDGWPVRS